MDIEQVGPLFENSALFPDRVNAGFVRVVNRKMLKVRVWERGNGETPHAERALAPRLSLPWRTGIAIKPRI